ncbi:MAG: undecaprenyldiphospho-muramoylpentapeptide beta-N-acetylglucosaminyltransferase [Saprospiraceae bacterium]|mgnify:FL=1
MSIKVIISGGGTGGHVFPAIAIAEALRVMRPAIDILFVGAKGKLEMEKVPQAGFRIVGLAISGFQRRLTVRNLLFPFRLLGSLWRSRGIVRRFKPDVVVGVGGYASGPLVEMATRMGVPALIQEQNSLPGVTNRILASKADRICVAYEGMDRFFPKGKLLLTGNPIRKGVQMDGGNPDDAKRHFGLDPTKAMVLVVGGSLGARSINEGMRDQIDLIRSRTGVQWLWQYGKLYENEFGTCATALLPQVSAVAFVDAMNMAYAAADVVITRAGALTISELALCGKAAVLVPSPNVAEDHQTKNARALADAGAARLVKDDEAGEAISEALRVLDSIELTEKLRKGISTFAKPDAARDIATEILKLAENKRNES